MGRTWPEEDNEPLHVQLNGSPVPGHHGEFRDTVVCMEGSRREVLQKRPV